MGYYSTPLVLEFEADFSRSTIQQHDWLEFRKNDLQRSVIGELASWKPTYEDVELFDAQGNHCMTVKKVTGFSVGINPTADIKENHIPEDAAKIQKFFTKHNTPFTVSFTIMGENGTSDMHHWVINNEQILTAEAELHITHGELHAVPGV